MWQSILLYTHWSQFQWNPRVSHKRNIRIISSHCHQLFGQQCSWSTFQSFSPMDQWHVLDCQLYNFETGSHIFTTFFVFAYLVPLTVMCILSICTFYHINKQKKIFQHVSGQAQKKKKASNHLILVVVFFALLWLHINVHFMEASHCELSQTEHYFIISRFWNILAYANSCVNPIIYNFASKKFRDAFKTIINKLFFLFMWKKRGS